MIRRFPSIFCASLVLCRGLSARAFAGSGDPAKFREGARYPAPEFGLYSSAPDLFRFHQMLLNGGVYEARLYLSRQSIETMTRVFTPPVNPSGWMGGTGYGLTFEVVDKPEGTGGAARSVVMQIGEAAVVQ